MSDRPLAEDLDHYRGLVSELALPSQPQIDDFIDQVATAHSWYKHLPMFPPGRPFRFFFDPSAGMDVTVTSTGETALTERGPDAVAFHYAHMPTAKYRARFGYLSFHCGGAPRFAVAEPGKTTDLSDRINILTPDGVSGLPTEILEAGTALVTAAIHPEAAMPWLWERYLTDRDFRKRRGSPRQWREQVRLWRIRRAVSANDADRAIAEILAPRREQERRAMAKAIERMLDFVSASR